MGEVAEGRAEEVLVERGNGLVLVLQERGQLCLLLPGGKKRAQLEREEERMQRSRWMTEQPRDEDPEGSERSAMKQR